MDQLSATTVLADYERQWESAYLAWITRRPENEAVRWERLNDLSRTIRGHCVAYHLIPTVDVGALHD
jgi:hypothetical protein